MSFKENLEIQNMINFHSFIEAMLIKEILNLKYYLSMSISLYCFVDHNLDNLKYYLH